MRRSYHFLRSSRRFAGRLCVLTAALAATSLLQPLPLAASTALCSGTLAERHEAERLAVYEALDRLAAVEEELEVLHTRFRTIAGIVSLFTPSEIRLAPSTPVHRARDTYALHTYLLAQSTASRADFRTASFTGWDLAALPSCSLPGGSLQPPLQTPFGSRFGTRTDPFTGQPRHHAGLDFGAPSGTPVVSAADGVVTRAERSAGGYGQLVEIDHGDGVRTRYAHLSRISVELGENITQGSQIGLVGSTGRSTAPHLHFEVRVEGVAVDPVPWL
jgi:murein DD-endopeptidase MepM/ murein hydrolase activator NlpD